MDAIAQSLLAVLTELLPLVQQLGSSRVERIINILIALIPIAIEEQQALLTPIRNIIAILAASKDATEAQLAALQALDAQVDAAFDAAAAADING